MDQKRYQLSPNINFISDSQSGLTMAYHSLFGNPRILNREGVDFLELFNRPMTAKKISEICDGSPEEIIDEFNAIYFIVEVGLDEREFLNKKRTEYLLKFIAGEFIDRMGLAISDSCNFNCNHCIHFQPSSKDECLAVYQKPYKKLIMDWPTAKKCVDFYTGLMKRRGLSHCKIHFGNAEPLINWPVIEKVLIYCDRMNDLTFEFCINTNLTLMTKQIAETLKKHHVNISTSLDGTHRANDAVRVFKGGRSTFRYIVEKFDLLDKVKYSLDGFSITVTKGNFDLIDVDVIDFAKQRGMNFIAFDYDLISLTGIPLIDRVEKLMYFKNYANNVGIDFFGTWDSVFRNLTNQSLIYGNHAFCAAVEGRSLEFNVEGGIKVCSHMTEEVGHINYVEKLFKEGNRMYGLVRDRFPGSDKFCLGCIIEGPCGGQCHVTREADTRSIHGDVEQKGDLFIDMCEFYRMITRRLALERISSSVNNENLSNFVKCSF